MTDSVATVWPLCTVQTCVIHLIRNTFRYAARQDWEKLSRDLRPVYIVPHRGRSAGSVRGLHAGMGREIPRDRHTLATRVGRVRSVPGLRRRNTEGDLFYQRDRKPQRPLPPGRASPGPLSHDQAAIKCLYLTTRALDATSTGRAKSCAGKAPSTPSPPRSKAASSRARPTSQSKTTYAETRHSQCGGDG